MRSDGHHCHARGCLVPTKPEMLMCRRHWFMVPPHLRARVWATYRAGQCDDKKPSREWYTAADAAIAAVAAREVSPSEKGLMGEVRKCSVCGGTAGLGACSTCALDNDRFVLLCRRAACFDAHAKAEQRGPAPPSWSVVCRDCPKIVHCRDDGHTCVDAKLRWPPFAQPLPEHA